MDKSTGELPHKITLDERERLTLTGAAEILHFDGELARIAASRGLVVIHGRELKLKTLSLEGGVVSVTGKVNAIVYEESGGRRKWFP